MSDLNANENEREANLSASEVLRAAKHQLIDDLVQNPSGRHRNYNEGGCTIEQFNRMHPPLFDGRGDPSLAEDWIHDIEEILRVLTCTDEQKVAYATFKLTGEAKSQFREDKAMEFATLIRNFSEIVNKAIVFERTLQRSTALHEQRKRTTPTGYHSGIDQGPWKKRNEGSSLGKRPVQGNQQPYQCRTCNQVHSGECRKGAGSCFRCGKSGHYIKDWPMQLGSNKATIPPPQRSEVPARGSNLRPTALARVFALTPREVKDRNDVIIGLKVRLVPPIISAIQVGKLLRDGCQGFLAYVVEAPKEELKLEQIPVVSEYQEVFP
ncbi:hypothetical protein F2P56_014646 [Juglans regia]|uniref:CCHC-type domain-containing protein n=2 Tax=Juglans regia TaxID=51240 RepID=A0A834CMZ7_JUGRE|nr:uncharacterized protein LOC108984195 [Juglans regia]KAF5464575.1 hypothetical protein F2P56_014646 [Juglans regia]